jgi:hypothetical protein
LGFDPSASKDAFEQGFTTCEIEDLPSGAPSRSHCDNLYDSEQPYDAELRNYAFSSVDDADRVVAYPAAQFGAKAASNDAITTGVVDSGDYTDGGLGKLGVGPKGMGDPAPNKNPIDKR